MAMRELAAPSGRFTSMDCITATYGAVLEGLACDPAVLGDDWGYHDRQATETEWPLELLRISRRPPEETLRAWYDLSVSVTQHATPVRAWEHARGLLDSGRQVIVWVDVFYLPYSSHYQLQHHAHRIVLTGYNDTAAEVYDGYRGCLFAGHIEVSELLVAISSDELAEGRRGDPDWRNWTISVRAPKGVVTPLAEADVGAALARNTADFLPDSARPGRAGGLRLHDCVDTMRGSASSLAALSPAGMIEVSAWFAELASQRALNARFLRAAAGVLRLPALVSCAERAEEISRRWEMTRNYFYLRLRSKGRAAVVRITDLMAENADLEATWCQDIRRAVHVE